jgi:NAD(P)-dependent dehydrogenase (short-subunit alcohol dehydrogenase family)
MCIHTVNGKTALITGANSGVGLSSALALAQRGARVILGCRNASKAAEATREVAAVARGSEPTWVQVDLADLASVRAAAEELQADGEAIDILMLNAGVMAMPRSRTADGFEVHFGTNHLGHFALAGRLLPLLVAARAPRVVTTASLAHRVGRMRWHDPNWSGRFYSASLAYGQSKLANLLFMRELDRRARGAGSDLLSVAAHPGSAHTNLASQAGNRVVQWIYEGLRKLATQPAERGALPLLHAATAPGIPGGSYWGPSGPLEAFGQPAPAAMSRSARDDGAARRLWTLSEDLTGVSWGDLPPAAKPTIPRPLEEARP